MNSPITDITSELIRLNSGISIVRMGLGGILQYIHMRIYTTMTEARKSGGFLLSQYPRGTMVTFKVV